MKNTIFATTIVLLVSALLPLQAQFERKNPPSFFESARALAKDIDPDQLQELLPKYTTLFATTLPPNGFLLDQEARRELAAIALQLPTLSTAEKLTEVKRRADQWAARRLAGMETEIKLQPLQIFIVPDPAMSSYRIQATIGPALQSLEHWPRTFWYTPPEYAAAWETLIEYVGSGNLVAGMQSMHWDPENEKVATPTISIWSTASHQTLLHELAHVFQDIELLRRLGRAEYFRFKEITSSRTFDSPVLFKMMEIEVHGLLFALRANDEQQALVDAIDDAAIIGTYLEPLATLVSVSSDEASVRQTLNDLLTMQPPGKGLDFTRTLIDRVSWKALTEQAIALNEELDAMQEEDSTLTIYLLAYGDGFSQLRKLGLAKSFDPLHLR